MHLRNFRRKPAAVAATTMLALGALAGTAAAVLTGSSGSSQVRMDNLGDTATQHTSSTVWDNLIGSEMSIAVQESRLINARFTAQSKCYNGFGPCAVRIIAINVATGATIELDPASGTGFAFDAVSPGVHDETGEDHAMERSYRLPAGNYRLRVQFAVTSPLTKFLLANWHLAVETSA
jgi:hypothetical protein